MHRRSTLHRSFLPLAAALLAAIAGRPAFAWTSPAPDVVLYCGPALDHTLHALAARYTAQTHVPVHIFVAAPDGLTGLLVHRARADLVVTDAVTLHAMAAAKLVRADSIAPLGDDPFVLVAHAGADLPPGATAAQLLAAHPLVLTDPTTAADFDGAAILAEATPPLVAPHVAGAASTETVIAATRANPALLGLVHRTEAGVPGIILAATIAVPPTPYAGALVTLGQSGNAAALLAYIAGPDARAVLAEAGLETHA